jgi:hypothetical protein
MRETDVCRFVRAVVGVNLQKISELICSEECWAYANAFDGATVQGRSLLDFRVRLFVNDSIENLHLLAVPLRVSHTGAEMAEFLSALLQVLCGEKWKRKFVGLCTDGARRAVSMARLPA